MILSKMDVQMLNFSFYKYTNAENYILTEN